MLAHFDTDLLSRRNEPSRKAFKTDEGAHFVLVKNQAPLVGRGGSLGFWAGAFPVLSSAP
jgi:hypothetical protein